MLADKECGVGGRLRPLLGERRERGAVTGRSADAAAGGIKDPVRSGMRGRAGRCGAREEARNVVERDGRGPMGGWNKVCGGCGRGGLRR